MAVACRVLDAWGQGLTEATAVLVSCGHSPSALLDEWSIAEICQWGRHVAEHRMAPLRALAAGLGTLTDGLVSAGLLKRVGPGTEGRSGTGGRAPSGVTRTLLGQTKVGPRYRESASMRLDGASPGEGTSRAADLVAALRAAGLSVAVKGSRAGAVGGKG